jgi:NDP-sugar pyrophosphorylase family protein
MKAMILAAGFGTRLWPLTAGRTKPAIPFLNRPLIGYTIEYLRRYGFKDLIINLHHEPDSVRRQIGDGSHYGVKITYSVEEPEILGTSGALDHVRDQFDRETFVVINGKIITGVDLKASIETHRKLDALATLVLRPNHKRERFSEVLITANRRIEKFGGFPSSDTQHSALDTEHVPLMFTGIHILEPAIFDYIPRGVFSDFVKDVYRKALAEGKMIAAHIDEGFWYELSTLERYLAISLEFLQREGKSKIMDEGCVIESGARVERSVLWKNVRVARGARLLECIVGDNVTIPEGADFYRVAIVRAEPAIGTERGEKAQPGEIVGENLVVPLR